MSNEDKQANQRVERSFPVGSRCWGSTCGNAGDCDFITGKQSAIREKVKSFNKFNSDNDPYGEHDFGSFEHAGEKIIWKIDYYNTALKRRSDNPADPTKTVRVLTIMLEKEYLPHHHSRGSR